MKKSSPWFWCPVWILLIFTAFMIWYVPSVASVQSGLKETRQSLETSRGRENKQQDEYNKAVEELPLVQADLAEKGPLAEQAEENVSALKARRNELRSEKESLESLLSGSGNGQEDENHE